MSFKDITDGIKDIDRLLGSRARYFPDTIERATRKAIILQDRWVNSKFYLWGETVPWRTSFDDLEKAIKEARELTKIYNDILNDLEVVRL